MLDLWFFSPPKCSKLLVVSGFMSDALKLAEAQGVAWMMEPKNTKTAKFCNKVVGNSNIFVKCAPPIFCGGNEMIPNYDELGYFFWRWVGEKPPSRVEYDFDSF